jgi:hypothetical protein
MSHRPPYEEFATSPRPVRTKNLRIPWQAPQRDVTALSVLGPQGFDRLPDGIEAVLITGTKDDHQTHTTPGFHMFLEDAADCRSDAEEAK